MPNDTVTLELQGEVTLAKFADAVGRFSRLVDALSVEHHAPGVRWEIDDLEVGSAIATARGADERGTDSTDVGRIVGSYLEVGRALEAHTTIPFSSRVRREAEGLANVIGAGVEAVRFETAEADAIVRNGDAAQPRQGERAEMTGAYGAVTGRIQTLTSRSALRFTLFDTLNDRAVSCYLAEGEEAQARDIWDKVATVEGWVTREPESGRPLSVRRIRTVTVLTEAGPRGYERARGARPRSAGDARAEKRIRQLRDAG